MRQPARFLLFRAKEHDCLAADRLMGRHHHRGRSAGATDALQHAVVAGDSQSPTAILARNGHAKHAKLEESIDHPTRNFLLLIDYNSRMLALKIIIQSREQRIAPLTLF